jgi:hypothetical protein
MTPRFAAAVIVAALGGLSASAQSTSEQTVLSVTGSVDRMCILASPQVNVGAATNIGSVSGATVHIADLSNEDMTTRATNFTAQLGAMCNLGHQIVISSDRGGLWRSPAGLAIDGFASGVPYSATVSWSGAQAVLRATAASESSLQQTLAVDNPAVGDIELTFHIDQSATNGGSGLPLVSGSYSDVIRITMEPQ